METSIRKITYKDKDNVLCLTKQSALDYFPKVFEYWIKSYENLFLGIFRHDKELLGVADVFFSADNEAWLQGIRVNPKNQKKGFATKLIEFIEEECINRNIKEIRFNTTPLNTPMINLGEKLNYNKNGDWIVFRALIQDLVNFEKNTLEQNQHYKKSYFNPIVPFFNKFGLEYPQHPYIFSDFRTYTWQSINNKTKDFQPQIQLITTDNRRSGISVQEIDPIKYKTSILGITIGFGWGNVENMYNLIQNQIMEKKSKHFEKIRISLPKVYESVFSKLGIKLNQVNYPLIWSLYSKILDIK